MSKFFNVSKTMLREIDKINELEIKFKKMTDDGRLGITAAYQLSRIDKSKRNEAAKFLEKMTNDDIRNFIFYMTKNPKISVKEGVQLANKLKPKTVNILALPLDDELKTKLEKSARMKKMTIHEYVTKILKDLH